MTEQAEPVVRTAVIQRTSSGYPTPETVAGYLPRLYEVTDFTAERITISGTDYAGWSLHDYVIPRLASGGIWAKEITVVTAVLKDIGTPRQALVLPAGTMTMMRFRLTAVTAGGVGYTYSWGDSYEGYHPSFEAATADVLGRTGVRGQQSYDRIVKAWVFDPDAGWRRLDPLTGDELADQP
jgi:hypothetical protein